jgi:DnaK suppressor protein
VPTTQRLNSHLKVKEIESLKMIIQDEMNRIEDTQKHTEVNFSEVANSIKDEVDSANDQILLATSMRFSKRDAMYFRKLNKALAFVTDEDYGMCQECGEAISYARLKARPTSEMCIHCKEETEREESQNFFKRQSKSLSTSASA